MAKQTHRNSAASSNAADRGYGKVDTNKERDITTEVGKSKGQENNSGDFGNGNDGETGATGEDKLKSAVAAVPAKEKAVSTAGKTADAEDDYPA